MAKPVPSLAGIPDIYLYCQKCGSDVDMEFIRSGNAASACNCLPDSKRETFSWISSNSQLFHHFQSMNYLIVGETSALFCSNKNSIFFEL